MNAISISYEIRGTAPRTLFDILNTEDDAEDRLTFPGVISDEYIRQLENAGPKARGPIFFS